MALHVYTNAGEQCDKQAQVCKWASWISVSAGT
jgi:hypothetical protein